jgi:hypothetical protein
MISLLLLIIYAMHFIAKMQPIGVAQIKKNFVSFAYYFFFMGTVAM